MTCFELLILIIGPNAGPAFNKVDALSLQGNGYQALARGILSCKAAQYIKQ